MTPDLRARWVAALRSGEYRQARGRLCLTDDQGRPAYCCLGVLARVAGFADEDMAGWGHLPDEMVAKIAPFPQSPFINMNDREGLSFAEIADWIEAAHPSLTESP